ncbi:exodeoxyribonuclease VII small subunit [Oscillospiraceae bacterium LTW-04]|nr:exodeoxyribonuclease VII small subunit [Oscillospiraceae bacterium MB24-C1]
MTFEQALTRLDEITALLSNGSTSLEQSLALYAEGAGLIETCSQQLNEAKTKIEKLFPEKEGPSDAI